MPATTLGEFTLGAYLPGERLILLSDAPQYGDRLGGTLSHEKQHALNPYRHPDPVENERLNLEATARVTGDTSQLAGYHP